MKHIGQPATIAILLLSACAYGETLHVGPGAKFAMPSQAIAAAKDGDVIEIDSAGRYEGDVAVIRVNNLTLRGVGAGRPKIDAKGKDAGGKGIWVQYGQNLTVENVELIGARCPDKNGAGIRAQGKGLTVRHTRFYDCENGILGGVGEVVIENCEFDHCGHSAQPASHSLYISKECTKLTFRFNYSTYTHEGHLLKSRAVESWVMYNRISDEEGTGSAVADFPNGGLVVLVGNILHKGPKGQNNRVIAYGMEGVTHEHNGLYVINNTMVFENRRPFCFVRVEKAPEGFTPVIRNNLCIGTIPLTNWPKVDAGGNLMLKTADEAKLVNAREYDFHLNAGSPCVDQGVDPGKVGEVSLAPEFQYVHPAGQEKRPGDGRIDIGAYELRRGGE